MFAISAEIYVISSHRHRHHQPSAAVTLLPIPSVIWSLYGVRVVAIYRLIAICSKKVCPTSICGCSVAIMLDIEILIIIFYYLASGMKLQLQPTTLSCMGRCCAEVINYAKLLLITTAMRECQPASQSMANNHGAISSGRQWYL